MIQKDKFESKKFKSMMSKQKDTKTANINLLKSRKVPNK